jgi:predicted RNA-binding Zn-ribbon protein involved in translation (DUF1610 family)
MRGVAGNKNEKKKGDKQHKQKTKEGKEKEGKEKDKARKGEKRGPKARSATSGVARDKGRPSPATRDGSSGPAAASPMAGPPSPAAEDARVAPGGLRPKPRARAARPGRSMVPVPEPAGDSRTVLRPATVSSGTPLRIGKGGVEYLCGTCGAAILEATDRAEVRDVVFLCGACGAFNEVPT